METLDQLLLRAFLTPDGKHGFPASDVVSALRANAENGKATIGGELWVVENGKLQEAFPGVPGLDVWSVSARRPDESWAEYCARARDESLREFGTFDSNLEFSPEQRRLMFYHLQYTEELDIRSLIPRHKHDLERAEAAIAAGHTQVKPILPKLLEWLQDMNWPVADVLAPFLTSIGIDLEPHLRKIFQTDDELWKYWIINEILEESEPLAAVMKDELIRVARNPTESERTEELPLEAERVIRKFGLE